MSGQRVVEMLKVALDEKECNCNGLVNVMDHIEERRCFEEDRIYLFDRLELLIHDPSLTSNKEIIHLFFNRLRSTFIVISVSQSRLLNVFLPVFIDLSSSGRYVGIFHTL